MGQEANPAPSLASSNSIVNENVSSRTVEESVPLVVPSSTDSTSAGQPPESFVDYAALATPLDSSPFSGNPTVTSWPTASAIPNTPFFNPAQFNPSQPPAATKPPTFSLFAANPPTAPPAHPPPFKDPVAPPSTTPVAPPSTAPTGSFEIRIRIHSSHGLLRENLFRFEHQLPVGKLETTHVCTCAWTLVLVHLQCESKLRAVYLICYPNRNLNVACNLCTSCGTRNEQLRSAQFNWALQHPNNAKCAKYFVQNGRCSEYFLFKTSKVSIFQNTIE